MGKVFEPIESQVRHLPPVEKPLPLSEGGIIGGDHHRHHHHHHHQHHSHHHIHPHHHLSHPIHHGHNWSSIVERFCFQLTRMTQGLDSVAGSSLPFHWVLIHCIYILILHSSIHLLIIHSTCISLDGYIFSILHWTSHGGHVTIWNCAMYSTLI